MRFEPFQAKILEPGPVGWSVANTSIWVSPSEPHSDPHIIHFNMSYRPLALTGGRGLRAWIPATFACCNILLHPTVGTDAPFSSRLRSSVHAGPFPVGHSLISTSSSAQLSTIQLLFANSSTIFRCCTTSATTPSRHINPATNERLPVHHDSALILPISVVHLH